jgi:putative FmdB family regulatory protein
MPIYEYICKDCGERFSLLQGINVTEKETQCPKCSSGQVKKVISAFCCSTGSGGGAASVPSRGFSGGG